MDAMAILLLVALVGVAAACGAAADAAAGGHHFPPAGYAGAVAGAVAVLLGTNCLMPVAFAIDPYFLLVQDVPIGGVAGASSGCRSCSTGGCGRNSQPAVWRLRRR